MNKPTPSGQLVPAFETSLGLGDPEAPVMVDKAVLDHFNNELATNGRHTLKNHVDAANVAALFAKRAIRPDEIAALRREMFRVVTKGLVEVEQVLEGKKNWNPAQVRLFSVLTERVMPKLSTIAVEDSTKRSLDEMSVEEIEAIALGKRKHEAVDAVVKEGDRLDKAADRNERRQAHIHIKSELAHIVSLDEAEKKHIARNATRYSLRDEENRTLKSIVKFQPKPTEEQLAKLRASRAGGVRAMWARQGLSPEEIAVKEAEWIAKLKAGKQKLQRNREMRAALTMGLGDAAQIPEDLSEKRSEVLREFRVPSRKGVRSQSTLLRKQQEEQARQEREKENRENPRIYGAKNLPGLPPEVADKPRLRDLRKYRPDAFEEPKE